MLYNTSRELCYTLQVGDYATYYKYIYKMIYTAGASLYLWEYATFLFLF